MAQEGRFNFSSAWGMYKSRNIHRMDMLVTESSQPSSKNNMWKTWWLADIAVSSTSKSASDSVGGATNIAY